MYMNYTFPFDPNDKVVELGGGVGAAIFHPNVDIRPGPGVDIVADLNETLPFRDCEWDGVYSSYVIEHVSWRKVKSFLAECHRILSPGGRAVFITANTEAQMHYVLNKEEWDDDASCIIFGDQNYKENTHLNSLSPKYAIKLFQEAGFTDIMVIPYGELKTDMLIEARKPKLERKNLFDKDYFNGGKKVGGYAGEGYADYPVHWLTLEKILEHKPGSVLELGCARGYLVKKFQDLGIPASGLEISHHCLLTRAADGIVEWDICNTPWPINDKVFDMCISLAVMEHIPEQHLPAIISEIDRVSKRGLHGIDLGDKDNGFDKTHCTLRSLDWWKERLPASQVAVDKEELEHDVIPIIHFLPAGDDKVKINVGSFTNMFYDGWINLDILQLEEYAKIKGYKFLQHDARQRFPFGDNSVDLIYSSHFLEHLTYKEGLEFLKECRRIMKPGSTMRLLFPDTEKLINHYKEGNLSIFDEINDGCAEFGFQSNKLWNLLFCGHQAAYDWESVKAIASKAGFSKIERKKFRDGNPQLMKETIDFLPELSLYVEIHKD